MDLALLQMFHAVYQAGSFAPVAKARTVAPSSISRGIATLEDSLGARLFHRTTRRLTPTEAGETLYLRTAILVEELEAAREEVLDRSRRPSGLLRLSASVTFGLRVLSPLLPAFRQAYPEITLDLQLTDNRVDLVAERIDIAIRHGKLEDSGFAARALARVRYLPVCSPSFAATTGLPDHPSQLAALPLLSFSYPGFASHWQAQQGKDSMAVPITPVIRAGNADILRAAAVDGLGIALLADWTVREDLQVGRLVPVLPDWQFGPQGEEDESRLWMLFPSRRYVSAKARLFADFLSVHMRSQTASEA